jgi:hypothetical protein
MYVNQFKAPVKVYRLNVETEQRQFFKDISPLDVTGLCGLGHIVLNADGQA